MMSTVYREFIRKHKLEVIAEIGVFKGRTLKKLIQSGTCDHIKEYWAIDPWKEFPQEVGGMGTISQDVWDKMYKRVCGLMPWWKPLRIMRMTSKEATDLFPLRDFSEYFDFVFIDGDHSYKAVINDIFHWRPLVKKGKYIGGHDYGKGEEDGHEVKRAVLEFFKEEELEILSGDIWIKQL